MPRFETLINPDRDSESRPRPSPPCARNRRRLRVFLLMFIPVLLAGLAYTFSRPPEYRAQASISVSTAGVVSVRVPDRTTAGDGDDGGECRQHERTG